jgi:hypothetical protein
MAVTIENKTDERILLRFNSGLTRYLAPGETLESVEHVEVKGNARIKRLEDRHVIAMRQSTGEKKSSRSGDMSAAEAIKHIENTPREKLRDFLSSDENRTTVLRAMEEKQRE